MTDETVRSANLEREMQHLRDTLFGVAQWQGLGTPLPGLLTRLQNVERDFQILQQYLNCRFIDVPPVRKIIKCEENKQSTKGGKL